MQHLMMSIVAIVVIVVVVDLIVMVNLVEMEQTGTRALFETIVGISGVCGRGTS